MVLGRGGPLQFMELDDSFQAQKKRRTSVRCGVKCPAKMTLTVDPAGAYIVEYQETHFGHDREASKQQEGNSGVEFPGSYELDIFASLHELILRASTVRICVVREGFPLSCDTAVKMVCIFFPEEKTHLEFLESIWELRNSPRWKRFEDRVHIHFDRKQAVVMVAEVSESISAKL